MKQPAYPTFVRERELAAFGYRRVAGVDEAGRGPLAGPVVAAAVVIPFDFSSPKFSQLHDSKLLPEPLREALYEELTPCIEFGVGIVEADEIDRINIRQASWAAMQMAVSGLSKKRSRAKWRAPDYVLIDGLPYGPGPWPYEALVKGDGRSLSIAAASVIAKVTRDRLMKAHDVAFPHYGFASHKGYSAPAHLKALEIHGPCALHRRSYEPVRRLLSGACNAESREESVDSSFVAKTSSAPTALVVANLNFSHSVVKSKTST